MWKGSDGDVQSAPVPADKTTMSFGMVGYISCKCGWYGGCSGYQYRIELWLRGLDLCEEDLAQPLTQPSTQCYLQP